MDIFSGPFKIFWIQNILIEETSVHKKPLSDFYIPRRHFETPASVEDGLKGLPFTDCLLRIGLQLKVFYRWKIFHLSFKKTF